jgi:hypothetical protein
MDSLVTAKVAHQLLAELPASPLSSVMGRGSTSPEEATQLQASKIDVSGQRVPGPNRILTISSKYSFPGIAPTQANFWVWVDLRRISATSSRFLSKINNALNRRLNLSVK